MMPTTSSTTQPQELCILPFRNRLDSNLESVCFNLAEFGSASNEVECKNEFATTQVWDLPFAVLSMDETLDRIQQMIEDRTPSHVITANLNFAMLCDKSDEVKEVARRASLILCDGMPIYWRSMFTARPLPERVAGSDLIFRLAERASQCGHSIFLLGAAEGVAATTAKRLQELYPALKIAGTECPPFRKLDDAEHESLCQRIRDCKPDILLVAFGQPKGEVWIDENLDALNVPVAIQLGASFDFVAGTAKRAPRLFQKTGMEWFYRMLTDPNRLVPRYAGNALFLAKTMLKDLWDLFL